MASLVVAGSAYLASCSKDSEVENIIDEVENGVGAEEQPEGYFTATFTSGLYSPISRTPIDELSSRVQSLRYIIYKKDQNGVYQYYTGTAGNDKYLFGEDGTITEPIKWPYTPLSVELENGEYKVVFLGNMNEKQFVNGENKNDSIVTNYKGKYSASRINLPTVKGFYEETISDGGEGKTSNFFYWDTVEVSTSNPNAEVVLQRIVSKFEMSRETLASEDGSTARKAVLNSVSENLIDYLQTEQVLTELIQGELSEVTKPLFEELHIKYLDKMLISPLLNAVANSIDKTMLLQALIPQIDGILKMNEGENLLDLNALLNPWGSNAEYAIVGFNKFTKAVNFDNKPVEFYEATSESVPCFAYPMTPGSEVVGSKTYLEMYGLNGEWDIKRIDATDGTHSLIAGQVIDQTVDGWILPGCLHDADANLKYNFGANKPYHAVYSAAALNVYPIDPNQSNEQMGNLSITLDLGKILNLEKILNGKIEEISSNKMTGEYEKEIDELKKDPTLGSLVTDLLKSLLGLIGQILDSVIGLLTKHTVGEILDKVVFKALETLGVAGQEGLVNRIVGALCPEGGITIELPLNISLLNTENLEVSGGWTRVYDGELPEMQ